VVAGFYFGKLNIISNFCSADKSDLSSISQSLEADGEGIFEEWQRLSVVITSSLKSLTLSSTNSGLATHSFINS